MAEVDLTLARFAELADAWGADLRRWPETVRANASWLAARDPEAARLLERADALDALFDTYRVPGPGAALTQAIVDAASWPRAAARLRRWWMGLGFAGAALAGSVSGAAAITIAPPLPIEQALAQPAEAVGLFDDPQEDDRP